MMEMPRKAELNPPTLQDALEDAVDHAQREEIYASFTVGVILTRQLSVRHAHIDLSFQGRGCRCQVVGVPCMNGAFGVANSPPESTY